MRRRHFIATAALTAAAAACTRREPISIEAAVIVLDASDGSKTSRRCREIGPRLKEIAQRSRDFDVAVMITGSSEAPNPTIIVDWLSYRGTQSKVDQLIERSSIDCERTIVSRRGTPLRHGLEIASQALREHCSAIGARFERCGRQTLIAHSDFRESEDLDLRRALEDPAHRKILDTRRRPLFESIDLDFCGTEGNSAIEEIVWRAELGRPNLKITSTCTPSP